MAALKAKAKGGSGDSDKDKPIKVDRWDGNAVKNALDDSVRKIFVDVLGYKEKTIYIDLRLAISGAGCFVALFALLYDYLFPFPASKLVLIMCVLSYFTLMSVLTLYTTFIEKNYILFALQKDAAGLDPDNIWKVATTLKRFDHIYTVSITFEDGKTRKKRNVELSKSVADYVDEEGELKYDKFERDIRVQKDSLLESKKEN